MQKRLLYTFQGTGTDAHMPSRHYWSLYSQSFRN